MLWLNKINTFRQSCKAQGSIEAVSLFTLLFVLWLASGHSGTWEVEMTQRAEKESHQPPSPLHSASPSSEVFGPLKSPCKDIRKAAARSVCVWGTRVQAYRRACLTPSSGAVWSEPTIIPLEYIYVPLSKRGVLIYHSNHVITIPAEWIRGPWKVLSWQSFG